MSRPILTIALPFLFIGTLQLVSCTPRELSPAPPGGTYLSSSGGANFDQSVNLVDDTGQIIGYIAELSLQNIHRPQHLASTLYITAGGHGVFTSTDDGQSWSKLTIPLTRTTAFVHLANGTYLAAGTNDNNEGIVIRSLDEGKSWDKVLTIPSSAKKDGGQFFQIIKPPPPPAIYISSLVPDLFNDDHVFATTSTGDVLTGEDSAKVWHTSLRIKATRADPLTGRSDAPVRKIIPSPHIGDEVLLISGEGGLIRASGDSSENLIMPTGQVLDVAYVKQYPDSLLVGMSTGIYVTRDRGKSWTELNVPISKAQPLANTVVRVSPTNVNRIIVSINSIIYRSEDGGENWNTLSLELPNHIVTDISIDPNNAAKVLLTTAPIKT